MQQEAAAGELQGSGCLSLGLAASPKGWAKLPALTLALLLLLKAVLQAGLHQGSMSCGKVWSSCGPSQQWQRHAHICVALRQPHMQAGAGPVPLAAHSWLPSLELLLDEPLLLLRQVSTSLFGGGTTMS